MTTTKSTAECRDIKVDVRKVLFSIATFTTRDSRLYVREHSSSLTRGCVHVASSADVSALKKCAEKLGAGVWQESKKLNALFQWEAEGILVPDDNMDMKEGV